MWGPLPEWSPRGYGQHLIARGVTHPSLWGGKLPEPARKDPPMGEPRHHFQQQLRDLELEVLRMGDAARELFERSLGTLGGSPFVCDAVIAGDDEVDNHYLGIEDGILELLALQTPVASDLRLLTALMHINVHLERIADMAVNVAKITQLTRGLPPNATVLDHLEEMGSIATQLLE